MSENVPLRLLVALGRVAATDARGQRGDELFALGLVEHGERLEVDEQDWQYSLGHADAKEERITTDVILPRGKGNVYSRFWPSEG